MGGFRKPKPAPSPPKPKPVVTPTAIEVGQSTPNAAEISVTQNQKGRSSTILTGRQNNKLGKSNIERKTLLGS